MERGIDQGREEGIELGQVRILKRLLVQVFDEIPPDVERRLSTASRDEIDRWVDRVLVADSLEEVFGSE